MAAIAELVIFITLLYLAFWQKGIITYIISSVVTIMVGATWIDDLPAVSIMLWGLATYELYLVIILIFETGGMAKGMSQFKGLWDKVRGSVNDG